MYEPKSDYTRLALDVIKTYVQKGDVSEIKKRIPEGLMAEKLACFVSVHLTDGSLRGCIGTIEPFRENLQEEIISNAIAAVSHDTRFEPVQKNELDDLTVSVDILSAPIEIESTKELNPKIYGVIVSDGNWRRAVLLPNLDGIDTVEEQLDIVKRKAGITKNNSSDIKIKKFTSTRYH